MRIFKTQKLSLFIWTIFCFSFLLCNNANAFEKRLDKHMIDLVESGITHLNKVGKDQAYKDFSDVKGKFVEGVDYLFIYDYKGKCLAHGDNPKEYLGKNLLSYKDKFGTHVIKLLIDIAKSGGGFTGYYWPNPTTKMEQFRIAYVKALDNNTLIGTSHPIPMD